jgi:hypothetical protein
MAPWLRHDPWRGAALVAIKVVHSLVFFGEELSVGYLLYAGLRKRQDRAAAVAAGTIATESAIYFGNGRRCPLTALAEELGAEHGSVTDIYLPHWIAKRIFTYNAPLVVVIVLLHARVFRARRAARRATTGVRGPGLSSASHAFALATAANSRLPEARGRRGHGCATRSRSIQYRASQLRGTGQR